MINNLSERDLTIKEISELFTVYRLPTFANACRPASPFAKATEDKTVDKLFTAHSSRGLLIQHLLDMLSHFPHARFKFLGFLEHGHELIRYIEGSQDRNT